MKALAQGRSFRIVYSLIVCLAFLSCAPGVSAQANGKTARVLVLYWDNKDFPGNVRFDESFKNTMQAARLPNFEYYPEYFETTRFPGQSPTFFHDYLRQKYQGRPIDAVVATADLPLSFLMQYRAELFPHTPIVFVANRPPGRETLAAGAGATGIVHQSTGRETLNLALTLHPNTKQVFVISGSIERDKRFETVARQELKGFEDRVNVAYLTDLPLNELIAKTSNLPADSVALYVWQQAADEQGKLLESYEVLTRISRTSSAPIYGMGSGNLGSGIVGGYLQGSDSNGKKIAEMTLKILKGTRAQDIPVENAPTVIAFDWRELRRWQIAENSLPAGSVVRFAETSFWELYKWRIIGLIGAIIVEALLIAWLLLSQYRRRSVEGENIRLDEMANKAHRRLREIVSNVPGIVWETTIDPSTNERKTTFISDHLRKMLGYTPEEWLREPSGFGLTIIPEEQDRQIAERDSEAVIASGKDGVSQFRWQAKDGHIVWVESYLSAITDANDRTIGLRGVTIDITERKLAEEVAQESQEKNRAIVQAIPDLMFLQTRDGVYLDVQCNDPTELLVPPEDYIGRKMQDIVGPELAETFSHYAAKAIESGKPQMVEYKLPIKGEQRWYESRLVCCGDNILSVVRDITERREAVIALSESEGRLRLAQEAARVGTWEWHIPTGKSYWSEMIWRLLGLEPRDEETQVEQFLTHIHPDDRERTWNKVSEALAHGESYYDEFRIIRSDGKVLWLSSKGRVIRSPDGQPERMIGVNIDITERKLAEDSAQQSEGKNRAILQAIPDLMFLQSRDGTYLDYHCKRESDLILPPEKFMGKKMEEVLPPRLAKDLSVVFERAAETGEPQSYEYELMMDQNRRWFEARVVTNNGTILSVVRDITERKQAEIELRESEERFGKAFRANPQPMSLTRVADGLYLDVNDSFLEVSGYTREEVIGHTSLELNMWGTPEARSDFITKLSSQGSLVNTETRLRTKTGSFRLFLSSAEFLEIGGEQCLLVASSDITDRMAAQQAVRESEARFQNMADTAPVMIWMTDQHEGCTYVNKQWLDFTGRTFAEAMNHGWAESLHPDDRAASFEKCLAAFEKRVQYEFEYRLLRADGEYRWVLASGTPRFSPTGEFLGYIGSGIDITERKESEVALHKAHEELQELKNQLEAENIYLQQELQLDHTFGEIVGHSDAIKYVLFKISQVAGADTTVLITGETGTGKELVARAIHSASERKDRPMIRVNCAALAASLIESELFGHEKGAFTGAGTRKAGRFELADGGTIFLDEIGELPPELQVKLLRVIQEGEFERLGSNKTIKIDVRIIAATNRNLQHEVEKGTFREDLWYRLNVFPITVPPLRERKDDIPLMVEHFVARSARKFGKKITEISPRTLLDLQTHAWPGNVRELINVIERAVINTTGPVLHLADHFDAAAPHPAATQQSLEDVERQHILRTLESTGWRIEGPYGAAKILGLNPSTLRTRMSKLGIQRRKANAV
jgi:PAS domain S-box-containing protein